MVVVGDWADRLSPKLANAVKALARVMGTPSEAALIHLEGRIDAVKVVWSELLGLITRRNPRTHEHTWAPGLAREEYAPFFRTMVAFSGLLAACSGHISAQLNIRWGGHLFSKTDFPLIDYDPVDSPLPELATSVLLPDMAGDFWGAFIELCSLGVIDPKLYEPKVAKALQAIASDVGGKTPSPGLGMRFWSEADVMREFRIADRRRLLAMHRARKLVWVESWAGSRIYPDYQFRLGRSVSVEDWVTLVLRSTPEYFAGWSLALWLQSNQAKSEAFYREKLEARGLWTPSWGRDILGTFKALKTRKQRKLLTAGTPLYRVSPSAVVPFRFSQAERPRPGANAAPKGRFDPFASDTSLGSLYLAESRIGGWSEVLDREPVVTLRHLSSRDSWTLTPAHDREVVDLEGAPPAVGDLPYRAETQDLATHYAIENRPGLRSLLRTGNGYAVVLFGEAGVHLPAPAGIGYWSAERLPGLSDSCLWEYLVMRSADEDLPTVLRRFPGEVKLLD